MEPPEIKKLKMDVINRIAAGEIIQRPSNALKELIENSLDAKSTNIQITVKDGGLKLLQIQDNGTGIRKEDFEILCERFTTSKLNEFEDLYKLNTYGFRGEALASISHVAHLTITSKTKKDMCAYKASYIDSKLQGTPKPTAGNQGTIVTVEDLFYNMSVRRKALKSPKEEHQRISEIVSKYAIHNSNVGFALKKSGGSNSLRTPVDSNPMENIKIIYGNVIAREIIEFSVENEAFRFKAKGYITNVNYSTKKYEFLMFINHRLVDCQTLKKCIDQVYSTYLPKNCHPFVYLSLELDPGDVDVNMHPTKHEVRFLNEDQVIEAVTTAMETKLLSSNNSRVFYMQTKVPTVFEVHPEPSETKNIYPKDFVRTDAREQKIEKFFGPSVKKGQEKASDVEVVVSESNSEPKEANVNVSLTEEEFQKEHELFLERNEQFEDRILNKTADSVIDETPQQSEQCAPETKISAEKPAPGSGAKDRTDIKDLYPEPTHSRAFEITDILSAPDNGNTFAIETMEIKDPYSEPTHSKALEKIDILSAGDNGNTSANVRQEMKDPYSEPTHNRAHQSTNALASDNGNIRVKDPTSEPSTSKAHKNTDSLSAAFISKVTRVDTKLTSVLELRKEVEENYHKILRETFAQHVFVGPVTSTQALMQFSTRLYLCNTEKILSELFYQFVLYNFQNFSRYQFSSKLPIEELATICLELPEAGWTPEDGDKSELAKRIAEILTDKGPMLQDYFSMEIDEFGNLCSIPVLLENYVPDPSEIPMYVVRLATEVNWEEEKECFRTFARETANFYAHVSEETNEKGQDWKWVTEHVLYPAVKDYFIPPKSFVENGSILEIANLPNLYKVFERC